MRLILAHRLAWFLHYGVWPAGSIDHINGIRHDNRLVNLRDVTAAENSMNRRGEVNASGYPGVTKCHKRWGARIVVNGKRLWLGQHDTPEQAHATYRQAAILFGYHDNHGLPTIFG